jgi:hypothetical protein
MNLEMTIPEIHSAEVAAYIETARKDAHVLRSDTSLSPEVLERAEEALAWIEKAQKYNEARDEMQAAEEAIGEGLEPAVDWQYLEKIHEFLSVAGRILLEVREVVHIDSPAAKLIRNAVEAMNVVHTFIMEIAPGIGTE